MTENKPDSKTVFWNRVQLIAVLVVFLAPIVGAFVYKPTKFNNYGDLYTPAREISDLRLVGSQGEKQFASYKEESLWTFLVLAEGECSQDCERSILNTRQLRAMQGKYLEKLRSVFIHSGLPDAVAKDLSEKYQPVDVYKADSKDFAVWYKQFLGAVPQDKQKDRFYVVDSRGLLLISYPSDADPKWIKKDLSRLLKARR